MTGTAHTARAPHASPTSRMGFTTDRATLGDALATVGLAVPKSPALPILGGVLLNAHDGGLTISATDYDTAVTARLPGTVHTTGTLLVDHHEFAKLLAALVKGTRKRDADRLAVTVRTTDDGAPVVDLAGYTVSVTSYPVEDYPTIPDPGSALVHVDRETLTRDMARVLVTVSKDTACPMLTGINLELTPGTVTMAATDRFRLAVAPLPAVSRAGLANAHALVPGHLIASAVARFSGDRVRIALDDVTDPSLVSFTSDGVTVSVRTLAGQFPDYQRLLPTTTTGTVHTDRAALLAATRRAAAVLGAKRDRTGHVAMTVTSESIAVAPVLDDRADSVTAPEHPVAATGITESHTFWFNAAYLADALDSFTGDTITLHTQSSVNRPVLITDTEDGLTDTAAFRHLLMPVRAPAN